MTTLDSTPFTPPNTREAEGALDSTPFAPPQKNKQTSEVGDENFAESLVSLGESTLGMGNDMSRAFLQGITQNTYSDGKAWLLSSLMDKGIIDTPEHLNNLEGEELYKEILRGEQGETSRFRAESPYLSASADIVGGALSPNPAGKLQTASTAFRLGKTAVEGAIGGYFGEEVDKRDVYDAAFGAGVGVAFQGSLESLGWLVNKASSRKIAKELLDKETGEFTPITVAADLEDSTESSIHTFYSELAAPSFGAQKGVREQEAPFIVPLKDKVDSLTKELKEVIPSANKAIAILKNKQESLLNNYNTKRTELLKRPVQEHAEALEVLDLQFSKDIRNLSLDAENAIKASEDTFRLGTMLASMPEQVDGVFTQALNEAADPNAALKLLDAHWSSDGFAMLNNRSFTIDSKTFDPKTFKDDLATFAPDVRANMMPLIRLANTELRKVVDNGVISGKELTTIRTMFRQRINALGDDSGEAATKAAYSVVADRIENTIRGQLKGEKLGSYLNELKAYKTYTIFRNAVDIKSRKTGEHGAFSANDWMAALGKVSTKDRRQGEGLFREEAERLGRTITREQSVQKEVADKVGKKLSKQKAKELARKVSENARLVAESKDRMKRLKNKQASQRDVIAIAAEQKKLNELEPQLAEAKQSYNAMKERTLGKNVNWFKSLVTTSMLGTGVGTVAGAVTGDATIGGLSGLAAGVATSKNLIRPSVQRAVAGQTAPQEAVQGMLSSEAPDALQGVAKTNAEALKYISPVLTRILTQ